MKSYGVSLSPTDFTSHYLSVPCASSQMARLRSFCWLANTPSVSTSHLCPFTSWWTLGSFQNRALVDGAAIDMVGGAPWIWYFCILGSIPRSASAQSSGGSIFSFLRNHLPCFRGAAPAAIPTSGEGAPLSRLFTNTHLLCCWFPPIRQVRGRSSLG